jgi:hypothetical protein
MSEVIRSGYTYADLHVRMAFCSPGTTITDADLVAVFEVDVETQDKRVVQRGKKAVLASQVPLTAVKASQ